jgi:hypothetical protein
MVARKRKEEGNHKPLPLKNTKPGMKVEKNQQKYKMPFIPKRPSFPICLSRIARAPKVSPDRFDADQLGVFKELQPQAEKQNRYGLVASHHIK